MGKIKNFVKIFLYGEDYNKKNLNIRKNIRKIIKILIPLSLLLLLWIWYFYTYLDKPINRKPSLIGVWKEEVSSRPDVYIFLGDSTGTKSSWSGVEYHYSFKWKTKSNEFLMMYFNDDAVKVKKFRVGNHELNLYPANGDESKIEKYKRSY